jgi:hypothetical protein
MSAQITELITAPDNDEVVRDKIAQILLVESAAQMVLAATPGVAYTRAVAPPSDSTVVASGTGLQFGDYVITAGTLVAGAGPWEAVAPDGTTANVTTTASSDNIVFSTLGLTLTVTEDSEPWDTGDVITVTVYDPNQWKLRVFIGRSNPIASYQSGPDQDSADAVPIIHIWPDDETFEPGKSNVVERQTASGVFAIDCYGYGKSTATSTGHTPGDLKAFEEAARAKRLVRKILMASYYTYLDLRPIVGKRFPESVKYFQPEIEDRPATHVMAARLSLRVDFDEFSPQVSGQTIATITHQTIRESTGEVLLDLEYPIS